MRDRYMIILGLNAGAALIAFVAAGFWFISAAGKIPKSDKTYGGFLDTPDAIISALKYSAKWNRLAALFAGFSALVVTAAISGASALNFKRTHYGKLIPLRAAMGQPTLDSARATRPTKYRQSRSGDADCRSDWDALKLRIPVNPSEGSTWPELSIAGASRTPRKRAAGRYAALCPASIR
jgi:hypothetical protein